MSIFESPRKPKTALGYHRVLSPSAAVKVSPLALGGISIGSSWSEVFGKNDDPFQLLDTYFSLGGNFIDTSNTYNSEGSERLIGEWMEKRGNRDQMVIGTKYTAGYRAYNRDKEPLQSNFTGNSAKSMHISVRDSLRKLRTDYIDILYVHWWDFATSVEEVMRHLHAYVMAKQVLYLGVSDTPAWVVVKANEFARRHGLTPFSVYQGRWNAAYRDMEAEIIPMCEDQGMGIVPWAALGGGQLLSAEQRAEKEKNPDSQKGYGLREEDIKVSAVLERIARDKDTTLQAVALAYLFQQSTYVFPIVGVNTVEHVKAMPEALRIELSRDDIRSIHGAARFEPQFPMSFLFNYKHNQDYDLSLTAADNQQYQMAAWIDAPPKQPPYRPRKLEDAAS
ncbi:Aldo/keto reductase [Coniochaeta ligniaria NRRL 30616]|uniref:Aldo/keto reductase n=1 Tax=Coniochaeta ligniaria NRRL 30616 TaxID=1408157 RepID=A0A1J7INT5_9PEZI|nr:Aldo/keto reductase [Coniochaeta ligniaria NRRL 30616]